MFSFVDKRILIGFVASFVLLVVILFISYRNMNLYLQTNEKVVHTHEVLNQIQKIYSQVLEIESSQRGFVIYNDPSFGAAYDRHVSSISNHIDSLSHLLGDNEVQLAKVDTLAALIKKRVAFTRLNMKPKNVLPDSLPPVVASLRGKQLTDSIKALTRRMQAHEDSLLSTRIAAGNSTARDFYLIYFSFCVIIILIFLGVIAVVISQMTERFAAEEAIREASDNIRNLYDNAPCGYHSLDSDGIIVEANHTFLKWLGCEKEELVGKVKFSDLLTEASKEVFYASFPSFKKNGSIEGVEFELKKKDGSSFFVILNSTAIYNGAGQYVQSRSSTFDISPRKAAEEKAKFLNQELEAFNYSVSHDLRAPLRAIDSYTRIIEQDYGPSLDAEGQRLIGVVLQNTGRMNNLIDDLLDFSRLGRKELLKSSVDFNRLLGELLEEMEGELGGRLINMDIDLQDPELADRSMMKQVWFNLLSNALKYTRKKEVADIKIGAIETNGSRVYFIRDNGAGFDMKYYNKLFGVFKRLHSFREFEGTGVGLAFCHRIITRHGGRIWAEAEVDRGAAFFFTLNEHENTI